MLIVLGDFRWQTECFLQILCDLLSPADENVKVGLRETTQNKSLHLRSKTLEANAQAQPQSPVQRQHQGRATSAHHHLDNQEVRALWYPIVDQLIYWMLLLPHVYNHHLLNLGLLSLFRNAGKALSGLVWAELIRYECMALIIVRRGWREFGLLLSWETRRKGACWRGSCQCQTQNLVLWTVEVASTKNKVSGPSYRYIAFCSSYCVII